MSATVPVERETNATASGRLHAEELILESRVEEFFQQDEILSIDELRIMLESATMPSGYKIANCENSILIYLLNFDDVPSISASFTINEDCSFSACRNQKPVPKTVFSMLGETVQKLSDLLNALAVLKNIEQDEEFDWISTAIKCLQMARSHSQSNEKQSKLSFLVEQLNLLSISSKNRYRFSSSLLITAYSIHLASSSAYNRLRQQEVLSLPSTKTLQRVTQHVSPENCSVNIEYFKKRIAKLTYFEKHVNLIFDEVYIAKRLEYSKAHQSVLGLTAENSIASTILCFMVASVAGDYRDIVLMIPLSKISHSLILLNFWQIVKTLTEIGFCIVSVTADNHSSNRKAFLNLLGGTWKDSMDNPHNPSLPIHVLFDSTHNIKNFYNNLVNKKEFTYPDGPSTSQCKLEHLSQLMEEETPMTLKLAPHLSNRFIDPSNFERLSTKPALAVFNEKTVAALEFYNKPGFLETASLLEKVTKVWKILNVKSPSIGKAKRDIFKDPIRHSDDWKLDHLLQFRDFLKTWQQQSSKGLTKETCLAWCQTLSSTVALAKFLINSGFYYVLLGKLQSDPIEERFGWYRQMHGANYYVSARQIFESERKIKVLSLTKFSSYNLDELGHGELTPVNENLIEAFFDKLSPHDVEPDLSDLNAIYYVTGALVKSLLKNGCVKCKEMLSDPSDIELPSNNDPDFRIFFDNLNRSGLTAPSEIIFNFTYKLWELFTQIENDYDALCQ